VGSRAAQGGANQELIRVEGFVITQSATVAKSPPISQQREHLSTPIWGFPDTYSGESFKRRANYYARSVRLDKNERNDIARAWKEAGLDPRDFGIENYDNDDAETRISHGRAESYFTIGGKYGDFKGIRVVGDTLNRPYQEYTWVAVVELIGAWLQEVKVDLDTPDLLAELLRDREMLGTARVEAVENTPFSGDEQRQIAEQLRELKEYAKETHKLSERQMEALEAGFAAIEDASGRLGRIDWRNAALTLLLQAIYDAVLPAETTRDIFQMFVGSVGHLFGHPLPGLPGGGM
jgi:hypothetical protein